MSNTLSAIAAEALAVATSKGWTPLTPDSWDSETLIPAKLALLHSEVSEAVEAFRNGDKENFGEELADVILRTVGIAGGLGYDLDALVAAKMEKNRGRAYKHGGKRI